MDTTSTIDDVASFGTLTFATFISCLKAHNGGVLYYLAGEKFNGTATTKAMRIGIDSDGGINGKSSLQFTLYYNGELKT